MSSSASTPIALFAYNRPNHLVKTLNCLRRNKIPIIYAFSDGPKNSGQVQSVNEVRNILHAIDWCEVKLIEREKNLGLGASIRNGVSHVLEEHDRLIVVEDDIILRPGSYEYTVAALKHYENNPKVMTVSMWSHPLIVPENAKNGFFSKRFICWGWGTYRNAWRKYHGTPLEIYQKCEQKNIDVLSWGKDIKWQVDYSAEKDLWYVGYALTHFLHGKISFFPSESLVVNIGRDGSGSNMGADKNTENIELIDISVNAPQIWNDVSLVADLDRKFAQFFNPKKKKMIQRLRNLAGKIKSKILM